MSLAGDLRILYHMVLSPIRGGSHAERLESFYSAQAKGYDEFRKHLLKGRAEMYGALDVPTDGVWLDLGAGTGFNLEYLGDRLRALRQVYLIDLSRSLLQIARERAEHHGWTNVETLEADVTTVAPATLPADVATFSYSLTMIPDWFAAIDRAWELLRPGGTIGVVDFYVARKYAVAPFRRHSWFTRSFWPVWFAGDNVFPSSDHVPYLHRRFEVTRFSEHFMRMRYLPFFRVPFYIFIGRKPGPEKSAM
jgi:S-adenosylmethionine-diacylgycerolhomoserine-N-methlytransferase